MSGEGDRDGQGGSAGGAAVTGDTRGHGRRRPVENAGPPFEPTVEVETTVGLWAAVLAGPVAFMVHFFVVYLVAEAACAADAAEEMTFLGQGATSAVIVVATIVGVVVVGVDLLVMRRWSARTGSPGLLRVGSLLAWLSGLAIVVVGLPVLVLAVCGP
ncbi:hypothetical protein [Ilumatobacter sp.]|uniref:hypothetical protein n=1 Tax=Ilumatobacter sp. TaxID=1967498 RepID=UPI003B525406